MLRPQGFDEFIEASGCTAVTPTDIWDKIRGYYEGRPYHSWTHIGRGWELLHIQEVISYSHFHLGLLGGWLLHDAIYDPKRGDNEVMSAKLARKLYIDWGMGLAIALASENFILATDHRNEPIGEDQCVIADVDLAELAVDWEQFQINTQNVRKEYDFVSDQGFAEGRAKFLQSLLERKTIYKTPYFQQEFEAKARKNIERSIQELTA